jgi:hypothetical protein
MKDAFTFKLESDYITIQKHESLMNQEIQSSNEKLQEQIRRVRSKFESEVGHKLDE